MNQQPQQPNQLAADIKAAKSGVASFWRSFVGERDDFNRVSYFRNPESLLDEVLLLLWIALAVASGFTIYYGFRYHLSIFESEQNTEWEALSVAIAIFMMGEVLKVFLGHRFMRSVFSGMFKRGLPQLILVICMGILSYFTFQWSIDISSKGYGMVTANKAKKDALDKTGDYTAVTAPFDAQIADARKSIEAGQKVTWHGKLTWEGQQVIKDANKTLRQLNADRQKAIDDAKTREASFLALTGEKIGVSETRQNDYGGKAEYVVLFCLFMIGLIEVIAYRQNKASYDAADKGETPTTTPPQKSWFRSLIAPAAPSVTAVSQKKGEASRPDIAAKTEKTVVADEPQRPFIGFNRDADGNVRKSVHETHRLYFNEITDAQKEEILSKPLPTVSTTHWQSAVYEVNPALIFWSDGHFIMGRSTEEALYAAAKRWEEKTTTPSVKTPSESVITDLPSVITDSTNDESVITDSEAVITEELEKYDLTTKLILKAIAEQIRDLNAECRHYESKNGTLGKIAERIANKYIDTTNSVEAHKSTMPDRLFANYSKAANRARGILSDFKSQPDKEGSEA